MNMITKIKYRLGGDLIDEAGNRIHPLRNSRLLLFLLIPLLRPGIVRYLPGFHVLGMSLSIDDIVNFWVIVSVIIILIMFIFYGKITKLVLFIITYFTILLVSTIYNSGSIFGPMIPFARTICICLLLSMSLMENPIGLMKVLSRYLGAVFAANLVLLFVFEGPILYTVDTFDLARYFIGHRNEMAPISSLAILSTFAYSYVTKKFSVSSILIIIVILANHLVFAHFVTWSATTFAVDIMLIVCVLLILFTRIRSVFSFSILFSINVFLFFFIVIFRFQENFSFIIQDLLERSLTFTSRTFKWDMALDIIAESPIIGHGFTERGLILFGTLFTGAHNLVLEILLRGGFLSLFAYLAIVILAGRALAKRKSHSLSSIFSVGIFVALIASLMESFHINVYMFAIIALSFHIDRIIAAHESIGNKEAASLPKKGEVNIPPISL